MVHFKADQTKKKKKREECNNTQHDQITTTEQEEIYSKQSKKKTNLEQQSGKMLHEYVKNIKIMFNELHHTINIIRL